MKNVLLFVVASLLFSCSPYKSVPQPKTEFRGFWVATVVNIDWPKNAKDPVEKQKADYLKILDFYENLNFNAAIVQIRTAGDAFYDSQHAPWSRYLTGEEGKAPNTGIDILEWMIHETHKRGMEFHAWLNPYRATFDLKTDSLSPEHDYNQHPEWMLKYGKKYYYNPGLPQVRDKLVSIMREVVQGYDIDAIHFDDYFYPYKIKGEIFGDSIAYQKYAHPDLALEDWRRSNVDSLVKNIHKVIKSEKPWVQFGISPFGVWKNISTDPKGSDTKAGQTTYEDLYADPLLWMKKGWIDYLAPQAYWSMHLPVASHKTIVNWWAENSDNTNLYIGNGTYKIRNNSDKAWKKKKEIPNQIKLARNNNQVAGNIFFSAKSLMQKNKDVTRLLKRHFYQQKALPPVSPLHQQKKDNAIEYLSQIKIKDSVQFNFSTLENQGYALIYEAEKEILPNYPMNKLILKKLLNGTDSFSIYKNHIKRKKQIAITFLDKFGRESKPILIAVKQAK
ncbi:glycoside hydrolase family 10 protein [Costertonia aggregata]|uniref:Family 10 glycosylhydrolase n=1 Tax=Costertonia aggregata TaxID=343403 RepID=A0A7H9AKU5_9FLAO|nr:family 10 glycosylhydrolase [Costertonia aggregata]QLG44068.1 family 10 glycosylhydrolase [Costertonia aggregata]